MIELNKNNFEEAIKGDTPTFVKYFQIGCAPCTMVGGVLEGVQTKVQGIAFFEVNADKEPTLAMKAKLTGVPAMIMYKNSQEIGRIVGFKNEKEILEFIDKCSV